MWKTEVTLLVRGPGFPSASVGAEEDLEGLEIHMYGAIVTLPDPERPPATKWDWRRDGVMVRWGRDSLYDGFWRRDCTRGRLVIWVSMGLVLGGGCVNPGRVGWRLPSWDGDSDADTDLYEDVWTVREGTMSLRMLAPGTAIVVVAAAGL